MTDDQSTPTLRHRTRASPYIRILIFSFGAALIITAAATYWYLIRPMGWNGSLYAIFALVVTRWGGEAVYVALTSEEVTTSICRGRADVVTRNLIRQRQFSFPIGSVDQFVLEEEAFLKLLSIWTVSLVPMRGDVQRLANFKEKVTAEKFRDTAEALFYSAVDRHYIDRHQYLN